MNLQSSNRPRDLPVRLGTHGYRLDGDFAFLNAELHIPPHFSGSSFGLELWAQSAPYAGESPNGVKVAEISLELPTPIGAHVHRVDGRAALSPPLGNADHAMVMMLVENAGDARRIHDFANYGRLERFENPRFEGAVGYALHGDQVVLSAASVANPRPMGNSSGSLCLELWALSERYAGGAPRGHRLAGAELGSVSGQYHLPGIERRSAFVQPPSGRWQVALLLREWTVVSGYVTRDYRNFDLVYEWAAPERTSLVAGEPAASVLATVQPAVVAAPAAAVSARSIDKLRLIRPAADEGAISIAAAASAVVAPSAPPAAASSAPAIETRVAAAVEAPLATAPVVAAAPVAVAPVVAVAPGVAAAPVAAALPAPAPAASVTGKSRQLNVQTASVEELSKLPGLNLKIAKEIVKSRPFASLDALIDVRGIGEKTLRRIKALITL
jgi:DNA uptake protein ComE-like DNA-binding protein